jgi:DNA (cytosine-5)-methyltransferase 1
MWLQMVEPTVISTFSGCGGSSLGYKWAGFKELLAIDFDTNSVETFRLNFPEVPCWQRDIKTVTADEILTFCKIGKGDLDVFDGSPPCQGFSTAGKRNLNDTRNDLFLDFVRLIEGLQPKVFLMENVSGMIKGGYKGKFNEILKTLKDTGYNVKVKLMNAMWYEVPQSRERLIFIGVRNDLNREPSYPEPLKEFITFQEATKGIENYTDRELPEVLKKIGKVQPILWSSKPSIYKSIKGNLAGSFSLKWALWNKPLGTIPKSEISLTGIVHPNRERYLNIDELKVCASFPKDYKFTDRKNGCERIGNAVMPKMMYHIAKNSKDNILNGL